MRYSNNILARANGILGPIIGIGAVVYFSYHVLIGDRGVFAWWQMNQRVELATQMLSEQQKTRQGIELNVQLLKFEHLDPDMLEERARIVLNMGHPDDLIVIDTKFKSPAYE